MNTNQPPHETELMHPTGRFEDIQSMLINRHREFSPGVVRLAHLFEEDVYFDYGDVVSLMYVRLLLEAGAPESAVLLNLQDIVAMTDESPEAAQSLFSGLGKRLADKVSLYDHVFAVLSEREEDVREQYARATVRNIVRGLEGGSSHEKGRSLEELMRVIFATPIGFEVISTRYSTGDEEIDLIVKNNIDRPFWSALDSPLIFVECKNWTSAVGPSEVRDFEGKMRNHVHLARLGFFVAPGGFTKGARTEQQRAGRSEYVLVFIDARDLVEYADAGARTVEWLERLITRFA
jgi:hypothetical protein